MLGGTKRRDQQKQAERRIYPENHLLVLRLVRLPAPPARPQKHHERIHTNQKNNCNHPQHELQCAFPGHDTPSFGAGSSSRMMAYSWSYNFSAMAPCVAAPPARNAAASNDDSVTSSREAPEAFAAFTCASMQ